MVLNRIAAFPSTTCRCRHYREDHIQQRHKVNGCYDVIESGRQCTCDEFRPFYEDEDYSCSDKLDYYDDDVSENFFGDNYLVKMKKDLFIISDAKVIVINDQKLDRITARILAHDFLSNQGGWDEEEDQDEGGRSTI